MQTALTAISFFNQQADLSNQYRENALKNRTQQMHAQFNAKLAQTHGAYQKVRTRAPLAPSTSALLLGAHDTGAHDTYGRRARGVRACAHSCACAGPRVACMPAGQGQGGGPGGPEGQP